MRNPEYSAVEQKYASVPPAHGRDATQRSLSTYEAKRYRRVKDEGVSHEDV